MMGVMLSNPRLLYTLTLIASFLLGGFLFGFIVWAFREHAIRRNLRWHRDKLVTGLYRDIRELESELEAAHLELVDKKNKLEHVKILTAKLVSNVKET